MERESERKWVTTTAPQEPRLLTEFHDFSFRRRVSEAQAPHDVSKNLFLWRIFGVTQSFYHFLRGGLLFFWERTLWICRDSFYTICYLAFIARTEQLHCSNRSFQEEGGNVFIWIPSCLGFKPATSQYKAYSLILLASNTVLVFQEGEPGVKESEENIVQKQHSVIPFTLRGRRLQNHLTISCTWIISMYYITAVRWKNTSSKKK